MQFLLAFLTTLSLSSRGKGENFPIYDVTWATERDHSSTPNYAGHKSKRDQNPGVPIPLSEGDKMEILNLHNHLREHVFPPAANMRYMRYNEDIAFAAQIWANKCEFRHGRPPVSKFEEPVGQSLYKGYNASFSYYIKLWYDEVFDYNMRLKRCNNSAQCGHYLQIVWAESFLIGCGQSRCKTKRGEYNLFVCHYYRSLEVGAPYKIGLPCSLCADESGRFCYRNMCVSKEDCEREGWPCECNLKCHNCGVLNKSTCTCKCPPGWDFQDCSEKCTDISDYCGMEDGYRNSRLGCDMDNGSPKLHLCRKMCGTCEAITEKNKQETCCGGKLCGSGYALDCRRNCSCELLCPGPECYAYTDVINADACPENACRGITSISMVLILTISLHVLRESQET